MRLNCNVSLSNRDNSNVTKSVCSSLAICQDDKRCCQLVVANGNNKKKFNLKSNIQQVLNKFQNEGKITIRIIEPPTDIYISKCDPVQLKTFVSVLKLATSDSIRPALLSSSRQSPVTQRSMVVSSRSDLPLSSFPPTLERLELRDMNVTLVPKIESICKLTRLQSIAINNCPQLETLPRQLFNNCGKTLTQLAVMKCNLSQLPQINAPKCGLTYLNLAQNKLTNFYYTDLKLVSLNLNGNELTRLPREISRLAATLKYLKLADNRLSYLPREIDTFKLMEIDISGNRFNEQSICERFKSTNRMKDTSLLKICAKSVLKYKISYKYELPLSLTQLLESCQYCPCGEAIFGPMSIHYLMYNLSAIANTIVGPSTIPTRAAICSIKCFRKFS